MQCKCGLLIASTYTDGGKSYAKCYANHVTQVVKIQAASRLVSNRVLAVRIERDALSEVVAKQRLEEVQMVFNKKRKLVGKNSKGLGFYWVGDDKTVVACADNTKIVGFVQLRYTPSKIKIDGEPLTTRAVVFTYLLPKYRGKGIILGIYQYLVTQINLQSDSVCSPEGFATWKRLRDLGYKVEVIDTYKGPNINWKIPDVPLVVRRSE